MNKFDRIFLIGIGGAILAYHTFGIGSAGAVLGFIVGIFIGNRAEGGEKEK